MYCKPKLYGLFYFKTGLLIFWALWFIIAFLSNSTDFLFHKHLLLNDTKFRSNNYEIMEKVLSIYNTPSYILEILFCLDTITQAGIAFLFIIAAIKYFNSNLTYWKYANLAFIFSIALWCVFLIIEEAFIAYNYESVHIRLSVFEIISFLSFHSLNCQITCGDKNEK